MRPVSRPRTQQPDHRCGAGVGQGTTGVNADLDMRSGPQLACPFFITAQPTKSVHVDNHAPDRGRSRLVAVNLCNSQMDTFLVDALDPRRKPTDTVEIGRAHV